MNWLIHNFKPGVLFLLRIWLGGMMMMHSYESIFVEGMGGFADYLEKKHHFPAPLFFAWLGKGGEFVGGLLVFLGLFTRVGAVLIIGAMSVATFIAHWGHIFEHGELSLNYLIIAVVLFWQPQTALSVDRYLGSLK